jgi:hypothetical protein
LSDEIGTRHPIAPETLLKDTVEWVEHWGYRAAFVAPHREPKDFLPVLGGEPVLSGWEMVGKAGILYGRKNEPLFLAQVGDVLLWDGYIIKIEE